MVLPRHNLGYAGSLRADTPTKKEVNTLAQKDGMPTIISVDELAEKTAKRLHEKMKPAEQPIALTEPTDAGGNYKEALARMIKDVNCNWRWSGEHEKGDTEMKYFEAIGAVDGGSAVPEIWARDVFRCCPYPASAFWDAPYVKWHDDIKGRPGDTIHVITVGRAACAPGSCAEPTSTAATVSAVAITLEEYQCSHYICRDDLEDMVEDTVTELNENLMTCLDTCIDNAFIANITGHGSTLDKGTAIMDPTFIAEAIGTMRSATCEPVVLIIHPLIEANLMKSSQFVNAATFGDRSVITGGHIIQYLGLDIVVVPKGSLKYGVGTWSSLMLSRYAVHAAKKRDPIIEQQYLVQTQRKYIYASVRFGKSVVCNDGVLWMFTAG
jgi:hypothetical protein